MQEETKPPVSRRGLLRRAGTVAAGVGAAGVAGAVAGTPAHAADGQPLDIGEDNTGTNKTSLTAGNANTPTLKLSNTDAVGLPLELRPIQINQNGTSPVTQAQVNLLPSGSTYADNFGDLHVIGRGSDGNGNIVAYDNLLYSPTWATMVIPTPPLRILHTWSGHAGGRAFIVPGSATIEPSGLNRCIPRPWINGKPGPDMVIDLSAFIPRGFAAVQANLTLGDSDVSGWAALWPSDPDQNGFDEHPGNSSINYHRGGYYANFTQTVLGVGGRISLRLTQRATVILDILGFVLTDPYAQLEIPVNSGNPLVAKAFGALTESLKKRGLTPRR